MRFDKTTTFDDFRLAITDEWKSQFSGHSCDMGKIYYALKDGAFGNVSDGSYLELDLDASRNRTVGVRFAGHYSKDGNVVLRLVN